MSLGKFILERDQLQPTLYTGSTYTGIKVKYTNANSYVEYNMTSCSDPNATDLWIIIPLTGELSKGYISSSKLTLTVYIAQKRLNAKITETKVISDSASRLPNPDKLVHQPNAPNAPNDPYAYPYHPGGSRNKSHKVPKVHIGPLGGKYVIKNGKKKYLA